MDTNILQKRLLERGLIDEAAYAAATERATRLGQPIEEVLVEQGLIEDIALGEVIAELYGVPFVNLREKVLESDIVRRVPETLARNKRLVLYDIRDDVGYLAMANPQDPETVNAISRSIGLPLTVVYATDRAIGETLRHYQRELNEAIDELVRRNVGSADTRGRRPVATSSAPVIQIVDTVVKRAYDSHASDIHMEPMEKDAAVRFRIDGVLNDVVLIPHEIYQLVVARVKVLSHLRTDEHLAAQDGKIRLDVGEEQLDIRVSILPIIHGEKIVMRLLSQKQRRYTIDDLGLRKDDLRKIREAFLRPHGMILATGPTGSGKTTTLYAILRTLNTREVNITTVEDPVEYNMEGINQVQINPRTNLTFAHGLRSILRQDPDIIMVGEIRDEETASIAINAALTGHLVLSTLHTNDASTTLPRLLDMHVEPFLVASSVNVAIGQRLVRKVCTQCVTSSQLSDAQRDTLLRFLPPKSPLLEEVARRPRVFAGSGCSFCHGSGFRGRVGVYEVLTLDESVRELIIQKASADAIKQAARAQGMTTMMEDGVWKIFQGITTVDEVLRATQE